jgi:hypothetical protein
MLCFGTKDKELVSVEEEWLWLIYEFIKNAF